MAQLKIREMPKDDRPREKLAARGAIALNDAELIAILLRTGVEGANAIEVARQLIEKYGSLGTESLHSAGTGEDQGIGFAKGRNWRRPSVSASDSRAKSLRGGKSKHRSRSTAARNRDASVHKESLRTILLDTRYNLIRWRTSR
jgi:DNA repair protein RadC